MQTNKSYNYRSKQPQNLVLYEMQSSKCGGEAIDSCQANQPDTMRQIIAKGREITDLKVYNLKFSTGIVALNPV